jgi:hypothetical protein
VRLEVAELSLAALDGASADAVVLFVGPERPLQGLAGLVDWRLAGALSRTLRAGHFQGAAGEQLLLPTQGRARAPRVFCFGVADPPGDEVGFRALAYRTLDALIRAGSRVQVTSLPPVRPGSIGAAQAARLWLEACLRFPPERQLLLGDAQALRSDLAAARDALHVNVELGAPEPTRVAGPGPSLPGSRGVVR